MKLFAVSLAVAALSAGAASAQDYRLAYGDLTLSNPTDARTLDTRINRTARDACRRLGGLDATHCQRLFRAEAMRQLPSQARSEYASSRRSPVTL